VAVWEHVLRGDTAQRLKAAIKRYSNSWKVS